MGYYGYPYGVPYGKNEDFTSYFWNSFVPGGVINSLITTFRQNYCIVIDGAVGPRAYLQPGVLSQLIATNPDPSKKSHLISQVPLGEYSNKIIDVTVQQIIEEIGRTDRLKLTITPVLAFSCPEPQISGISLVGVKRYSNCRPIEGHRNWAGLDLTIQSNGLDHNISLGLNGIPFSTGFISGDGLVTLNDISGTGLGATFTLTYTNDGTFPVTAIFPIAYKIHMRRNTPFIPADFPRSAEVTILDSSRGQYFYRSDQLLAGTWYVVIHQIPDGGIEATTAVNQSIVINTIPAQAGKLTFLSGDSTATVLGFQASATPGATYNFYDSGVSPSGAFNIAVPDYTHIAGAGSLTQVLPSLGVGFNGYRGVWIQAVSGGVTDGGGNTLLLQYVNGQVVNVGLPPAPIAVKPKISGRTITIPYQVDIRQDQFGNLTMPVAVALFMYQLPNNPDFDNPDVIALITSLPIGNLLVGNIIFTIPSDGDWYFVLRTMAVDSTQSLNINVNGPFLLSNAVAPDPVFSISEGS